jgi:hypothetical protein
MKSNRCLTGMLLAMGLSGCSVAPVPHQQPAGSPSTPLTTDPTVAVPETTKQPASSPATKAPPISAVLTL